MPITGFNRRHVQILGIVAILISLGAWVSDWTGAVYVCPYCRVQRTVIGILGLGMLSPVGLGWIGRYLATVIGSLGIVVGATQHFRGWAKISAGEFALRDPFYIDPFLLSGCALFIIVGQVMLYYATVQRR